LYGYPKVYTCASGDNPPLRCIILQTTGYRRFSRPQSSSASRLTAGAAGFLLLIQCGERPEIQGEPSRFASEGIMSRSLRRPSARTDLDHLPIKDHMHSLTLLPWPLLNVLQQVCTNLLVVLTRPVTYCVRAFSGKPANACPVMNALGRRTPCARTSFPAMASIALRKTAFRIRRIGILP